MTTCEQCGHDLDGGRFCTQCGAAVRHTEPGPAGAPGAAPARSLSRSVPRYPLFAEEPDATVVRPSLAETAVQPSAVALAEPEPEPLLRSELTEPVRRPGRDRTWLTSFAILAGVLAVMLVAGVLLVLS
jgi:hypothetical protein